MRAWQYFALATAGAFTACGGPVDETSSTAQETVVVSPTSHDFGSLTVGGMSPLFTESINPSGVSSYDTVNAVTEGCPDFYIDAPGLPAEVVRVCEPTCVAPNCVPNAQKAAVICMVTEYQNYQFSTWFQPSIPGTQSCVVTVTLNGGSTIKTFTLSGTGVAPPIDIDVSPGALAFGDVRHDTDSSASSLTVRNLGSGTLSVSSVTANGPYAISGPTSFGLPGGGAQTLDVTCHPGTGPANGSIVIASNDSTTPSVTIPVSCNGVDSNLGISPSPAVFSATRVGEPRSMTIDLVNSGGASTTVNSVTVTGTGFTLANGATDLELGPGASTSVTVDFDAATHGEMAGSLEVVTSDGTRTAQIAATALLASMSLTPDGEVDFGPVCAGQMATQTFTVIGNGDGAFQITDVAATTEPFALTAPGLPASVAGSGGSMATFSITASPTAAGVVSGGTTITTDIPGDAPRAVALTVTGLAAGISPTPVMLDLGGNKVATTTIGQSVKLTNCDPAPVGWSNARIEGEAAAEFAIVSQPMGTTIGSTTSVEWLVVMTPQSVGPKEAEFVVDYEGGGTVRVPLVGDGLGDLDPTTAGDDESSYYECNAGGVAGLAPMAFVLVGLLRRRRR